MKIAFIGYGNMSSALISGVLSSGKFNNSNDVTIFHNKKKSEFNLEKCIFLESGSESKDYFDIIFLCVKPKDIEKAIKHLEDPKLLVEDSVTNMLMNGKKILDDYDEAKIDWEYEAFP